MELKRVFRLIRVLALLCPFCPGAVFGARMNVLWTSETAVRAMIEGIHSYRANKEETLKVISKYMKVRDREVLE